MRRQYQVLFSILGVVLFAVVLGFIFPRVMIFVEGAALSILRFWWVVLIVALGSWAVWVLNKRN